MLTWAASKLEFVGFVGLSEHSDCAVSAEFAGSKPLQLACTSFLCCHHQSFDFRALTEILPPHTLLSHFVSGVHPFGGGAGRRQFDSKSNICRGLGRWLFQSEDTPIHVLASGAHTITSSQSKPDTALNAATPYPHTRFAQSAATTWVASWLRCQKRASSAFASSLVQTSNRLNRCS